MRAYRHTINAALRVAERKAGIEGWKAYQWQAADVGDDAIVTGCVPSGVYSRGPRKGLPKFSPATPGTKLTVVVTRAELDAAAIEYESAGPCYECGGTGQTFAGWNAETGTRTRDCVRCSASGKAPDGAA